MPINAAPLINKQMDLARQLNSEACCIDQTDYTQFMSLRCKFMSTTKIYITRPSVAQIYPLRDYYCFQKVHFACSSDDDANELVQSLVYCQPF